MQAHKNRRCIDNPVITIGSVTPTAADMHVLGVFNCGGVRAEGKTILLCRVAEAYDPDRDRSIRVPRRSAGRPLESETFRLDDKTYDFSDNRIVTDRRSGKAVALTSYSSFRLATSEDGIHFTVGEQPCEIPLTDLEEWGIEDPRITPLEGRYYLTYSSVSRYGVGVSMAVTDDFRRFDPLGMVLPPANKDAVLFPEKIGDRYYLLHRPSLEGAIGSSDIWIAESNDLLHWGGHRLLCKADTKNAWESRKIGAGTPPIRIPEGWLVFYHGVDERERYSMGALLLDPDDPTKILKRTAAPVMQPKMPYETDGFFSETVFPTAAFVQGSDIVVYYGAADTSVCRVDIPLDSLWG